MPFRKLQAQPALCTTVQVFNDPRTSRDHIAAVGEAFLCVVYGWKIDEAWMSRGGPLRNREWREIRFGDSATNVSSSTSTLVSGVPPSTAVAWYRIGSYRLGRATASVGEAAFHAHRCVDSVRDMVVATTIRAMTQMTEKTIRMGLMKTNWTPHQRRKDDDSSG